MGHNIKFRLTSIRHIRRSHDTPDLFHALQIRTETAVTTENLFIDNGGDRQTIEAIGKGFPQFDVEAPLALIIKTVYSINGGALVIAPQQKEILWVFDFVGQQQTDGFQRLLPSIDVVAQK